MFSIQWTSNAAATYNELKSKAEASLKARKAKRKSKATPEEGLFKQIHKTIDLLRGNPRHPGLRTHEYDSIQNPFDDEEKVFEAYAQNNTPGLTESSGVMAQEKKRYRSSQSPLTRSPLNCKGNRRPAAACGLAGGIAKPQAALMAAP